MAIWHDPARAIESGLLGPALWQTPDVAADAGQAMLAASVSPLPGGTRYDEFDQ